MDQAAKDRRLRWHCRRGMLELDIFLLNFFDNHYQNLSEEDKSLFSDLLACNDQDLFVWLTGRENPENEQFARIATMIRDSHIAAH